MIKIELEGTKASHFVSFSSDGVSKQDHTELRLDHRRVPQVRYANHQIRYSFERRNDRDFAEMDSRCRTRKAHKNQTGDHSQPKHAHHNLEHGHEMAVKRFRIHVAVT